MDEQLQEAVTEAKAEEVPQKDLYGELRKTVIETREKYRRQSLEIKEKLDKNAREKELLATLLHKLEGAIEASDFYAKAVLPSNNK